MRRFATDRTEDPKPSPRTIYELAPDRFLIFRPRDYEHPLHAHPHRYRLRVIKGRLEVVLGERRMIAAPDRRVVTLEPGKPHTTRALEDTWAIIERETARR